MYATNSKLCRKCQFKSLLYNNGDASGEIFCNYIVWTGKQRGCAGGDGCPKYRPRKFALKPRPLRLKAKCLEPWQKKRVYTLEEFGLSTDE